MRTHSRWPVLLVCCVLGCGADGKNVFTANGFHQGRYQYDVAYQDAGAQRILPDDWRIDNYYSQPLRPKTSGKYETEVVFDGDGDGRYEATETLATYDLRFENKHSAGVIWLRSIPIDSTDSDKDLRVLMRNAVDSVAGGEYVYWKVGDRIFGSGEHLVAQQLDEMPATVAGHEAYVSTVELASADQLKLNDKRRLRHIRLVMIRSGLLHKLVPRWTDATFPVVIVAGLSDLPEYFENDLPVFDRFIGQIKIGGIRGYQTATQPKAEVSKVSKASDAVNVQSSGDSATSTKASESN